VGVTFEELKPQANGLTLRARWNYSTETRQRRLPWATSRATVLLASLALAA